MKDEVIVLPGQIWKDCDKRGPARYLYVLRTNGTHAYCSRCDAFGNVIEPTRKPTKIMMRRMKPGATGYALVTGGSAAA